MGYKSLVGIGQVPKLTLINKATRTSIAMNHVNSVEVEMKQDNFYAMKAGLKSVAFAKSPEGSIKVGCELVSSFILKELYNMNLVEAKVGSGTTLFKAKEYVTVALGVVPAMNALDVPLTGTMSVLLNDIPLTLVTGTPVTGEYKFDSVTRIITLQSTTPIGTKIIVEGKVLDETKQRIEFAGVSTPAVFEAYIDLFEVSDEDGSVIKTTVYIGKLVIKKTVKIIASTDKVSSWDFEGDILVDEDGNMESFIN